MSPTDGWTQHIDPSSNRPYFYNTQTGLTQWERPPNFGLVSVKSTPAASSMSAKDAVRAALGDGNFLQLQSVYESDDAGGAGVFVGSGDGQGGVQREPDQRGSLDFAEHDYAAIGEENSLGARGSRDSLVVSNGENDVRDDQSKESGKDEYRRSYELKPPLQREKNPLGSNHHSGFNVEMLAHLPPLRQNPSAGNYSETSAARQARLKKAEDAAAVKNLERASKNLNKNYVHLAREYTLTAKYRDLSSQSTPCVMCKKEVATVVFFPCEHKCICALCKSAHKIGMPTETGSWNYCAICCGEIKIAFISDGTEVERYWRWVKEVKPTIGTAFLRKFDKRSRARIKRAGGVTTADDEDGGSKLCTVM